MQMVLERVLVRPAAVVLGLRFGPEVVGRVVAADLERDQVIQFVGGVLRVGDAVCGEDGMPLGGGDVAVLRRPARGTYRRGGDSGEDFTWGEPRVRQR
jgi:hypothetical protein